MASNDTSAAAATAPIVSCDSGSPYNGSLGLRVGALFIILTTSLVGTLFPVIARRIPSLKVPTAAFDFVKYFGSGVIIATAFIHLLAPAFDELTAPCLTGTWTVYDWAPAIAMMSVFMIFILEIIAFRIGSARLRKLGLDNYNAHDHALGIGHHHAAEHNDHHTGTGLIDSASTTLKNDEASKIIEEPGKLEDPEQGPVLLEDDEVIDSQAMAQILGVAILEFGVIFHSLIIGLTLAVTDDFNTLFVVIIFHQMFEGLGLGSRLAFLPLPKRMRYVPFIGAIAYAVVTPLGMAFGLGFRETYNPDSPTANIVSGILDALSAGILLYTGLVELLAHEFIFNDKMRNAPTGKLVISLGTVCLGAAIMALLGRWA
ncbi:uncharacterized protein L969DRAFT_17204 [Mixia osmundae IAM 14324]|uniref:ZIP zinc/iron transport family n=1 Tax=Mixia osmundae (strain CBS 9802 / IAM 14324 / JCM 22182 / KY 12970) TaxID=764103 RepID=G7DZQ4_MIXOS|nr:uncharacterized protein L969DRAFT_17204 [Mixia osmundae IAM 14324]KEI39277.1 hypothetical protein L969DRAFT_17204 [Mixia osmundae IAM 14324]GAA96064.1 hypothetical protein E5Q_02725 [Mixia osmundae IAM 14324]